MPDYRYLIVGGGMTADSAVQGIRTADKDGSIGLFGAESERPYNRPPLSKDLWKGEPVESIWRGTDETGVDLHLGRRIVKLDPENKTVTDDRGEAHGYEKLLLATGGTPRRLPAAPEGVIYFRGLDDYRRLRELADTRERFAVIGGGFIGSEIAAALALNDRKVTMLFPEAGIGARAFPDDLSHFINDYYRERGVEVLAEQPVATVEHRNGGYEITTASGRTIAADAVVAGIGIIPNVELAHQADIVVDNGIVVDRGLRTSRPDIFAAGDVAAFRNPGLDKRVRVEHEDNANIQGQMAGQAMTGAEVDYDYLPFFYSDLFDLGYEAVGEVDSRLEVVSDWEEPYRKGVIYYLDGGHVQGVLLWGVSGKIEAARDLIFEPHPMDPADLEGRIRG